MINNVLLIRKIFKKLDFNVQGTYTSAEGSKYEGYWREGNPFGPATFTFEGGDEIEGYFKDGEFVPK
jgi:hypothetical protein